ncbi:E3 ubiquitin-protein ligase SH3RF2-like [Arvicola amphibius]|uniref:E3 ubiquitin-protein ligase SH3RF2-like n=1 Tax=Arvicola amphibius TaxID=1047088 RepID=UPI001C08C3F1|nr:E3 ubiquitin-protein ligase SH3RF2-like [Arvicola amphibius]
MEGVWRQHQGFGVRWQSELLLYSTHTATRKTEQYGQPVFHVVMCPENSGLWYDADYVMTGVKEFGRSGGFHFHFLPISAEEDAELVPRAKALCNYRGKNPGDLKFNKGDVILLRRQLDENWYQGEINGISGIFPASSVEVIKQLPQPPPLCRALYNFELRDKDKSENQDCLTFLKDDIITVISRVDENWAEGKLGDKVGIFPILFVEPNLTARHLLEKNKGHQLSRTKNLSLMSSPSRGKATNTPTLRKSPGSRRKGSGQFSITTALNTLNRMVHSPEGHQMVEISTPVLISSSSSSAFTQPGDKADFPANSAGQTTSCDQAFMLYVAKGIKSKLLPRHPLNGLP